MKGDKSQERLHFLKEIILDDGSIVRIRRAEVRDAKNLLDYINKAGGESDFLTFGAGEFGRDVKGEEEFIKNISAQDNALFIVAERNGEIIGNAGITGGPRPRIRHTGEFGLSILKDYWGAGIGTAIVKVIIDWSRDSDIFRKINLRVRSDNEGAIHIYKKLGFKEEGLITREFYVNGKFYDAIWMGMEID
ncbi:RimJ/RimL family protein N-acetyltransferase [Acetoanaerobium pronyense]|uniref:RimJ/RimL family protein N-acetyltransferase n=1 Tax=Acetoanaerobium pronyense TaxID=1482736 RepID=A0ABS4KHB7_9FIRM|nr:GNAT family protein [Acetoanaerobium pronyense]MBP2027176.1 RimJ/RimL family protein N-acetyltransferase [Acetoanaerobium pronyense]